MTFIVYKSIQVPSVIIYEQKTSAQNVLSVLDLSQDYTIQTMLFTDKKNCPASIDPFGDSNYVQTSGLCCCQHLFRHDAFWDKKPNDIVQAE